MHTHFKPFICYECAILLPDPNKSKRFAEKNDLLKHARVSHPNLVGGRKEFLCPHCDATFTRSDNMGRHLKKEHGGPVGTG